MEAWNVGRMVSLIRGNGTTAPSRDALRLAGCPVHDLKSRLRAAGLRPTRQRVALGWLLFGRGDRHVCADSLFDEAQGARVPVSLATIYNTLNQFTQAGLLREIPLEGARSYFDTRVTHHHHFYTEEDGLTDISEHDVSIARLPTPPEGMVIERVDVVVRLRKKST